MPADGGARTIATFVVAAAVLLQSVLAAPLALRMLAGTDDVWAIPLCTGESIGGAVAPARGPQPPACPHNRYCPVCLSHGAPLAILPGIAFVLKTNRVWRRYVWIAVRQAVTGRLFHGYESRAPPILT